MTVDVRPRPAALDRAWPARRHSLELVRARVAAYVALTKPRIIELLLVTTVPALVLAANGWPSLRVTLTTLVCGSLAAGSASAFNCVLDRDIDAVMHRTSQRPLARHTVTPARATVFAAVLGVVAVAGMAELVNPVSAGLTLGAIAFYVIVYTAGLKRRTVENIVIGGAAGCFPTLIGWAAVTGHVAPAAWVLFAIVFFWTPPHFWSLALRFREDYARADVPMLPVVRPAPVVTRRIIAYSLLTVAASFGVAPLVGSGPLYLVSAGVLGLLLLGESVQLHRRALAAQPLRALRLFHFSISYLTLLFVALTVDTLLR